MNLIEIRKQLASITGRYDLMNDDFTDNGIDFYINAGQNLLDKRGICVDNEIGLYIPLVANDYSVSLNRKIVSIQEVWINDNETRSKLDKVTLPELKEYYSDVISDITPGRPIYYTLANIRALEAADRDDIGTFLNLEFIAGTDYRGLILGPPSDGDYTLEIFGKFYNTILSANNQENYWTVNNPEVLIKASMYQLYKMTGRSRDADDIANALNIELSDIDKSIVEEDIYGITELEG
jgi:hypothetical protein